MISCGRSGSIDGSRYPNAPHYPNNLVTSPDSGRARDASGAIARLAQSPWAKA
ncbi:MAG: hypothetical protein ACO4AJ_04410 [Prochlorothrix sp.]